MSFTHLDLFSGIGGFALAARWAGIETVQFVEIDPFCQKVLRKNFPGVSIHDDIKTFTYAADTDNPWGNRGQGEMQLRRSNCRHIKNFDGKNLQSSPFILTGGFPCQPFSCAGKRRGKEDDRYLWPEMLRVISEARPTWVIGENVAGFINMGLNDCISDLENQGYEVQAFIIPACAVNAPHRRDRVWIVANNQRGGFGTERERRGLETMDGGRADNAMSVTEPDRHAPDTDNTKTARQREHGGGILRITEPEGLNIPSWQEPWLEAATRLCRVDDGIPRQVDRVNRLKAFGNAIVPQVAYAIMRAIVEVDG